MYFRCQYYCDNYIFFLQGFAWGQQSSSRERVAADIEGTDLEEKVEADEDEAERDTRGFRQIYEALVAYKTAYGHVEVPTRW